VIARDSGAGLRAEARKSLSLNSRVFPFTLVGEVASEDDFIEEHAMIEGMR